MDFFLMWFAGKLEKSAEEKRLRRAHEHADRRRRLAIGRSALVKRVRLVDPQQRWDAGGPDVDDLGVGDLTVDLHHHLKLFVLDDAVCNGKKRNRMVLKS